MVSKYDFYTVITIRSWPSVKDKHFCEQSKLIYAGFALQNYHIHLFVNQIHSFANFARFLKPLYSNKIRCNNT